VEKLTVAVVLPTDTDEMVVVPVGGPSVVNPTPVDPGPEPYELTPRRYTVYAVFWDNPETVTGLTASAGDRAVQEELLNEYS
jgi:hypothetical protein